VSHAVLPTCPATSEGREGVAHKPREQAPAPAWAVGEHGTRNRHPQLLTTRESGAARDVRVSFRAKGKALEGRSKGPHGCATRVYLLERCFVQFGTHQLPPKESPLKLSPAGLGTRPLPSPRAIANTDRGRTRHPAVLAPRRSCGLSRAFCASQSPSRRTGARWGRDGRPVVANLTHPHPCASCGLP
jgi:hypothetical protein